MARARYVASAKHGSAAYNTARGVASRAPTNGQAVLDTALELGNGTRRVGVDRAANEFVVFDQTSNIALLPGVPRPCSRLVRTYFADAVPLDSRRLREPGGKEPGAVMVRVQPLGHYDHEAVEDALTRDDAEELQQAVVAVALGDPDYTFAHELCLRLARHKDATVRGNAFLGFGHLARRFGEASAEARTLVSAGLKDRDLHVKAQAESAFDDIQMFAARG